MKVFLSYIEGGERKVDGPYEGIPAIAEEIDNLRARGIHHIEQTRLDIVCDFCSSPGVVARFHITPGGVIGAVDSGQGIETHVDRDGIWGCCEICRDIIMAKKPGELVGRSVMMGQKIHPDTLGRLPVVVVAEIVAGPHSLFWAGWDGSDPEPVISDEELLGGKNA